MSQVKVYCPEQHSMMAVNCHSIICPDCRSHIVPTYLAYYKGTLFCECPVAGCGALFLARGIGNELVVLPNHALSKETFSDIIETISPQFVKIYNEAYSSEQISLMEICGVGYRKSLEFLIKDYVCRGKDDDTIDQIRRMPLSQCVSSYVSDLRIKSVSSRAIWLGNDETHYTRKWETKDVKDLKSLIRLTVRWIEQEVETDRLLQEMPEGR